MMVCRILVFMRFFGPLEPSGDRALEESVLGGLGQFERVMRLATLVVATGGALPVYARASEIIMMSPYTRHQRWQQQQQQHAVASVPSQAPVGRASQGAYTPSKAPTTEK